MPKQTRTLTEGQRAYEAKRAARAGMSLEKWLAQKDRQTAEAARAEAQARRAAEVKPAKPPGFFARWLEKAHKPL
jgi:hypothetical protein